MTRSMVHAALALLLVACAAGCTNHGSSPTGDAGNTADGGASSADGGNAGDAGVRHDGGDALPACSWPASLDSNDRPRSACRAARQLLRCGSSGGSGAICVADDDTCAIAPEYQPCQDQCGADEYAISCGAIGPDTGSPDPPEGCHDELATPGGTFFMCCPCGQ